MKYLTLDLALSPADILDLFEVGGLELQAWKGLDVRLHDRYYNDPPEFFTVLSGDSDGLHYGLWYDDPAQLPNRVMHFYSRDDPSIGGSCATLLEQIRPGLEKKANNDYEPEEDVYEADGCRAQFRALIQAFETGDRPEQGREYLEKYHGLAWHDQRIATVDCAGAFTGGGQPFERDCPAIREAMTDESPEVEAWIAHARKALNDGDALPALALGHRVRE